MASRRFGSAPFRGYRSALLWLYCCLWVYPLFGQNWHRKWWYIGLGTFGTFRMEIGLRRFHLGVHCGVTEQVRGGNAVTNVLAAQCDYMHKFEGEWQLSELYDHACLAQEAFLGLLRGCSTATVLYWSSILVYVLLIATITSLMVCAFLVLYFETGDPSTKWKRWCVALYFLSYCTQFCLVLAYSALNFNLSELYQPMMVGGSIGKIVFNSPSTVWLTASFTAWYALVLLAFGFVLAWWTVLDLSVSDQLFEDLALDGPGLNALEKEVLFGNLAATTGYGATPGPYGAPPAAAAPGYGAPGPYEPPVPSAPPGAGYAPGHYDPAGYGAAAGPYAPPAPAPLGITDYGTPAGPYPGRGLPDAAAGYVPGVAPSPPGPYDQYATHGYPAPTHTSQY